MFFRIRNIRSITIFKNGIYETTDKEIIAELKKDKNIQVRKSIEEIVTHVKENTSK